jgi:hypothetical protein
MKPEEPDSGLEPIIRRLRELPTEARPPFDWVEFQSRAAHQRDGFLRLDWRHVLAAASVAIAIGALAVWSRVVSPGADPVAISVADSYTVPPIESPLPRHDATRWLMALPQDPAIVRVDSELAITDLEDSIAWIDELLTLERAGTPRPDRVSTLQHERSRLVDSLVQVRYAETLASELR